MDEIKQQAQAQFGKTAAGYATSPTHANAPDLQWLVEAAAPQPTHAVLDVATGAGHTALALAPHVARVVASDLTPEMLAQARRLAGERGLTNIEFVLADSEALPFADASFDRVTCRIAFHHFPQPALAVREMARVLRPGGRLLLIDNYAPADDVADAFINQLDKERDRSHVRAHRLEEWAQFFAQAGLSFAVVRTYTSAVDFVDWAGRADTPPEVTARLQAMLLAAPAGAQAAFGIAVEPLGFRQHKALAVGEKPTV